MVKQMGLSPQLSDNFCGIYDFCGVKTGVFPWVESPLWKVIFSAPRWASEKSPVYPVYGKLQVQQSYHVTMSQSQLRCVWVLDVPLSGRLFFGFAWRAMKNQGIPGSFLQHPSANPGFGPKLAVVFIVEKVHCWKRSDLTNVIGKSHKYTYIYMCVCLIINNWRLQLILMPLISEHACCCWFHRCFQEPG